MVICLWWATSHRAHNTQTSTGTRTYIHNKTRGKEIQSVIMLEWINKSCPFLLLLLPFLETKSLPTAFLGCSQQGQQALTLDRKWEMALKSSHWSSWKMWRLLEVEHRQQHPQQDCRARLTHTHSYLLYVVARFRTSLNKHYIKFFGFPLTLFNRYLPVVNKGVKRCTTKDTIYFIKKTL